MATSPDGRAVRYQLRRGELVEAVAEHLAEHGVSNVSLRAVAHSAGVSHATLLHHFGTRERLVAEVVEHVLERTLVPRLADPALAATETPEQLLLRLWGVWSSADGLRHLRLFVALTGAGLFDDGTVRELVRASHDRRRGVLHDALVLRGRPADEAQIEAGLVAALFRGLVTDLLVTGDLDRVDATARRAVELVAGADARPESDRQSW